MAARRGDRRPPPPQPKRARGRLIAQHPPPRGWRPGWTPANPVRRCSCGHAARVRSVRFERCELGCTRPLEAPRPPRPPPAPPPPPAEFSRLLELVCGLERDLLRDACKGRPPNARVTALATSAAESLAERFPAYASRVWGECPWLARRRSELAFLAERSAR